METIASLALVNKLRIILLMEAYFTFNNKLILDKRMMEQARSEGRIPSGQYSNAQSMTEDGSFDKILQGGLSLPLLMFVLMPAILLILQDIKPLQHSGNISHLFL